MKFERFGRTEADAPVAVLSAGLGGLGGFWRPQFAALAERCSVIVYDQRGTGANAGMLPADYSIAHMAADVLEILDAAGAERCHFIGHALGGLVGLQLALTAPQRLRSLVPVNAWARLDSATARCFDARLAVLQGGGPDAYVRAQPIFLYPSAWMSANAERMEADAQHGIAHFQGSDILLTRIAALRAFDIADRLAEVKVPTLVMAAEDDVLVPYTASETLAHGLADARLWMADWGGHACSVTDPEPFTRVLMDFLTEMDHG